MDGVGDISVRAIKKSRDYKKRERLKREVQKKEKGLLLDRRGGRRGIKVKPGPSYLSDDINEMCTLADRKEGKSTGLKHLEKKSSYSLLS